MSSDKKLQALLQKKAKLEQKIAAVAAKQKAIERKEDARLKILIGAAMLADSKINPNTALFITEVLERAITSERDKAFLTKKGWNTDDVLKRLAELEKNQKQK